MAKPSNMITKLKQELEAKYKLREYHMRLFVLQYSQDAAMIAAAEVFGMGETRAKRYGEAFCRAVEEISRLIYEDGKDDKDCEYARAKIDEKLKQICGKNFEPWEKRYENT